MSGMTAPTPTPGTAPPGAPADGQGQPPPVATTPPGTTPPAGTPATGQPAPTTGTGPDPASKPLDLTQADLDRIVNDRLARAQQSWEAKQAEQNKKLAAIFGGTETEPVDPAKALETAQQTATAAQKRADRADAKALALAAGVDAKHIGLFMRLVDTTGVLKDIDRGNDDAVTGALQSAVDKALTEAPMFKGPALPASSGGDRQGQGQPSIDERIAAAEKAGDFTTAISLKRQKAFRTG